MIDVTKYLAGLPEDRSSAIAAVRAVILKNLPKGYAETMSFGMITYEVPLAIQPKTYNGKPLMYAALASQKNHMAIYLCGLYCFPGAEEKFATAWKATGRKLDMGKSCLRFKKLDDLDLDLIAATIKSTPVPDFIAANAR